MLPSDPEKYPHVYAREFIDTRLPTFYDESPIPEEARIDRNREIDPLIHDIARALRLDPEWFERKLADARLRELREADRAGS